MPTFTKDVIKSSFMKLLGSMPFDSITVKNIVDDCGINRNTFYYNFDDIYALVDEILRDEINRIAKEHLTHSSWRDALLYAADFTLKNKAAVYNLHNSSKRPQLEKYLQRVIFDVVGAYVRHEAEGIDAKQEDISFVADFYSCALVGLLDKWLDEGVKGDFETIIGKTAAMFDGNIKQALDAVAGL